MTSYLVFVYEQLAIFQRFKFAVYCLVQLA